MAAADEAALQVQLQQQAKAIEVLTKKKRELEANLAGVEGLIDKADELLERVKEDVDAHVQEIERAVVQQVKADSIQFTHEEVLRYSQLKRDEFTSTSKRIASHAATVSRRKRYRWCRDASSGLYWAWGGLCLAVVKVLPFLDPRPPHAPAKHA